MAHVLHERMKKRIIILALVLVVVAGFYLTAFHGERRSFKTHDGKTYFTSKQYFFGKVLSERRWSDPADAPNPPQESGIIGPSESWRGFGFAWRRTVYYE